MANPTSGVFEADGESEAYTPLTRVGLRSAGAYNLTIWGEFEAEVILERSFDHGENWIPVSLDAVGTPAIWTGEVSVVVEEIEPQVEHRLHCHLTSGVVNYRMSQ